jgi:hypothetical protein
VDVWLNPKLLSATVPAWAVQLLRFQVGVVYLFAGLAKLNPDWLLSAQPMRMWLMARSDLPLIGPLLAEPWMPYASSWAAAGYDLTIPFFLMRARTRVWACVAVLCFHAMTSLLFPIGMFPWIMLAAATGFLPPEWARRALNRIGVTTPPPIGSSRTSSQPANSYMLAAPALSLILIYCLVQVLVPLRSWLYPQQGAWDIRGFNFAWRVMLVEKTGYAEFFAVDAANGDRQRISLSHCITSRQQMMMSQDPHLLRAMARYLSREYPHQEIHVSAFATLNGRASQKIVRDDVDLGAAQLENWIVPLQTKQYSSVASMTGIAHH